MEIRELQVNHRNSAVGIDGGDIAISWKPEGGIAQTAYKVRVRTVEGAILEDSGKVATSAMQHKLKKRIPWKTRAFAEVTVWDEEDHASAPKTMEIITGMAGEQWKADWISSEQMTPKKGSKEPRYAGYLRKTFRLEKKPDPRTAYLYATAHGIFNLWVNGAEYKDSVLMPGTQQCNKRLMVETLDLSDYLKAGENELLVSLGDGWYRGSMGFNQDKNVFGDDISFLAQLDVAGQTVLKTDASWLASLDGPLRTNDMMDGEFYDATKEEIRGWRGASVMDFGYANLIATDTVPMTEHEHFEARLITTPNGERVLDFGQNLVGYLYLDFDADETLAGKKITLVHGEALDKDGNFTLANFQNPMKPTKQQIDYICRSGRNFYHPTKTYMGFRYVKVEAEMEVRAEWFSAAAVYSDIPVTADFTCGNELVNKLFENALWSMKGNFVDVPTDCPTREKSGYSGDAQAFVVTAMYLMDCYPVYAKWLREQAATQFEDGVVAQIAPNTRLKKVMSDGGMGWCDSLEIIPNKMMKRYADDELVRELYPAIRAWMLSQVKRASKSKWRNRKALPKELLPYMIDTGWMWGEWKEPDNDRPLGHFQDMLGRGNMEVGTSYLYYGCKLTAEMAERIGETADAALFHEVAGKAREAYRHLFLPDGHITEEKHQCNYVRPLFMGILDEKEEPEAVERLVALIEKKGDHLNTGFLTTHELSRTLSDHGQTKKAYDLLLQKTKPGWLYAVTQGCTAIPEDWNCYDEEGEPKGSFNHYSYGAIAGWLIDSACGIRCEDGNVTIAPHPDERLGYAKASYDSPVGRIVSGWNYEDGTCHYYVEIPANCQAQITLPEGKSVTVTAGVYNF